MPEDDDVRVFWASQKRVVRISAEIADNFNLIENQTVDDAQIQSVVNAINFKNICESDEEPEREWWRDMMEQDLAQESGANTAVKYKHDTANCFTCVEYSVCSTETLVLNLWQTLDSIRHLSEWWHAQFWRAEAVREIHVLKWRDNVFVESNTPQEGKTETELLQIS